MILKGFFSLANTLNISAGSVVGSMNTFLVTRPIQVL